MKIGFAASLLAGLHACQQMTPFEAIEAVRESVGATRGAMAVGGPVALTRSVDGLDATPEVAAQALAAGWGAAVPCAVVVAAGPVVDVDLGEGCAVGSQALSGRLAIEILDAEGADRATAYTWDGLSADGLVVDGTAVADWTDQGDTHVALDAAWDDGTGATDAVAELWLGTVPAVGDGAEGVTVTGATAWTTDGGAWSSEVTGVRMRYDASLPEHGSYVVVNPAGRTLELDFQQVDQDSVQVTAVGMTFPLTWVADLQ